MFSNFVGGEPQLLDWAEGVGLAVVMEGSTIHQFSIDGAMEHDRVAPHLILLEDADPLQAALWLGSADEAAEAVAAGYSAVMRAPGMPYWLLVPHVDALMTARHDKDGAEFAVSFEPLDRAVENELRDQCFRRRTALLADDAPQSPSPALVRAFVDEFEMKAKALSEGVES